MLLKSIFQQHVDSHGMERATKNMVFALRGSFINRKKSICGLFQHTVNISLIFNSKPIREK